MTFPMRTLLVVLFLLALVAASLYTLFGRPYVTVSQTSGVITGYAWSDTIGWVSLNCSDLGSCGTSNYGLSVNTEGTISGYAWSEHVGWVSANAADVAGCPSSPCTPSIDLEGHFTGWFKALAASSGWDGWISLSGSGYEVAQSGASVIGYAWGDTVVGWLAFTNAQTTFVPCTPAYQCTDSTHRDNLCTVVIENEYCGAGNICSTGLCTVPGNATGELRINPALVPTGNTTTISWTVVDTTSCRVYGENGDEWYDDGEGSYTSSAINETTLYTLECANSLGEATSTVATAYATVVPTWVEK